MPIYAFICADCGPFDLARPVVQAGTPATCPVCGSEARRVYTPPGLALLAKPTRRALDVEDKSAHEPDVVTEKRGGSLPHKHRPTPPWVLAH